MMTYVGSQFVFVKILFGVELFFTEFIFCGKLKRKENFGWRVFLSIMVTLIIIALFPTPMKLTDQFGSIYGIFIYSIFYFLTILSLRFCFNERIWMILYISAAAYSIQHIASCLNSIFKFYDFKIAVFHIMGYELSLYRIICLIISNGAYVLGYFWVAKKMQLDETLQFTKKSVVFLTLVAIIVNHGFILLYFGIMEGRSITDGVIIYIFNIICCLLILAMQISIYEQTQNMREYAVVDKLWRQAKIQYRQSKENIDAINMKCHDMKHLIHVLEKKHSLEELGEIARIIESYEIGIQTGNETLDIILTEKASYCQNKGIQFTCLVNGKILNFIGTTDLYVLFGNLIDNCINAVTCIKDENRKNIGINVNQEKKFVIISTENYYSGKLVFMNGLPMTTKQDKTNHGYGMRSMQNIIEKYNGQMSIKAEMDIFSVNIIIPIC